MGVIGAQMPIRDETIVINRTSGPGLRANEQQMNKPSG
jgi:hypothetical protein